MSQLNKWMTGGKISKLVVVITSKETGENVERWQFDVRYLLDAPRFLVFSPNLFLNQSPSLGLIIQVQIFNKPNAKPGASTSKSAEQENVIPA